MKLVAERLNGKGILAASSQFLLILHKLSFHLSITGKLADDISSKKEVKEKSPTIIIAKTFLTQSVKAN